MLVEQAIFTSAVTRRARGYQLVGRSPGVCDTDARELTIWCPSHDALLEEGRGAQSVNFHPLESGAFCISRTVAGKSEHSERGALCVTTHCLVISPDLLARFANHPAAVLRAAIAGGVLDVGHPIPEHLPAFQLPGRAPVIDLDVLSQAVDLLGAQQFASLLHTALTADSFGLIADKEANQLLIALMNCLPLELRFQTSFSTGLKYSPRRPFHWFVTNTERGERRRLEEQFGVTIVEVETLEKARPAAPTEMVQEKGWAGYIAACLRSGNLGHLEAQLIRPRPGLSFDELEEIGDLLQEDLAAEALRRPAASRSDTGSRVAHAHASHTPLKVYSPSDAPSATSARLLEAPSQLIETETPGVLEELEKLDDVVYDAITGKTEALTRLTSLWPEVLDRLGCDLVEPSREQYLRYALGVWHDFIDQGDGSPEMAVAALGVLEVLCEE